MPYKFTPFTLVPRGKGQITVRKRTQDMPKSRSSKLIHKLFALHKAFRVFHILHETNMVGGVF